MYIRRSIIFLRLRVSTLLSCTGVPFTVHFVSVAPFLDRASRCMEFVKMFCKALNSPEKKKSSLVPLLAVGARLIKTGYYYYYDYYYYYN